MASSLSDEEFQRLQTQLLELRTNSYSLEEKNRKLVSEVTDLRSKYETAQKEVEKSSGRFSFVQSIGKGKKSKEVDALQKDNEILQQKLISQEEDFRLQNETLMQQFSLLVSRNEELEHRAREGSRDLDTSDSTERFSLMDDIRRLQAENAALQRNLTGEHSLQEEPTAAEGEELVQELNRRIAELRVKADTEEEENRMLRDQLQTRCAEMQSRINELQENYDMASEKLRKKQESLRQLQQEKEDLINGNSAKCVQLEDDKQRQLTKLSENNRVVEERLNLREQELLQLSGKFGNQVKELEAEISRLKAHAQATQAESSAQWEARRRQLEAELQETTARLLHVTEGKDDAVRQLEENRHAYENCLSHIQLLEEQVEQRTRERDELNVIAEKRRTTVDEVSVKIQQETEIHREEVRQMKTAAQVERDRYKEEMSQAEEEIRSLKNFRVKVQELESKWAAMVQEKDTLETDLRSVKDQFEQETVSHQNHVAEMENQYRTEMERINEDYRRQLQELESKLQISDSRANELSMTLDKYKQEAKDFVDAKRIHEKKGAAMLKELKKQLHVERKRAERLQEKLEELLAERGSVGVEELLRQDERPDRGDNSSVSSLSGIGSTFGSVISKDGSGNHHGSGTSSFILEQENNELLSRLAKLQEGKWLLEERVSHLEQANSSMADDLVQKTAIIQHYVMEGRREIQKPDSKTGIKRVLEMVSTAGDDDLREMNRRLQVIIEETLTKNMHLEKNLEHLSVELAKSSTAAQTTQTPTSS